MAAFTITTGKVSNIRQGQAGTTDVVNFKLGCRTGQKDKGGKASYLNFDCAVWGALVTKLIIPYIKEGDFVEVCGELNPPTIWKKDGKEGVNMSLKVLGVTLIGAQGQAPETNGDSLADNANKVLESPNVSPAAKEDVPF